MARSRDLPEVSSIERAVLTGLRQPRAVRCSFVDEVLDGPRDPDAAERWMLLQKEAVRRSYVKDVLDRD